MSRLLEEAGWVTHNYPAIPLRDYALIHIAAALVASPNPVGSAKDVARDAQEIVDALFPEPEATT